MLPLLVGVSPAARGAANLPQAQIWETFKLQPTAWQHPVRDVIDPVHFYCQRQNMIMTSLFSPEAEDRDLQLADGNS